MGPDFAITAGIFLVAMIGVSALLLAFAGEGSARSRALARRIDAIRKRTENAALPSVQLSSSIKRADSKSTVPGLESLAKRILPRRDLLKTRLERAGSSISLGLYALIVLVICGIATTFQMFIFSLPVGIALIGGVGVGLGLPHLVVGYLVGRRTRKFLALFPEAIELMVRGLKSGLPIAEELSVVGTEIDDPVGLEFRRITDSMRFGQTLDQAMWVAAKKLDIADFNFFVVSLSVQRETGGNLAETLENLSDVLRKRRQMKLKIRAMSSEARASAYIIGCLPFVLMMILLVLAPAYIGALFTDPRGMMILGVALFMMALGIMVMIKMVKFEI